MYTQIGNFCMKYTIWQPLVHLCTRNTELSLPYVIMAEKCR
jgi:hypothetical protein